MIKLTKILILLLILFSSAISAVLFEVKDNAGKIIMEVSDDGVRFFNPQYTPVQNEKDTLMVISATSIKALVRKAGGGSASRDFDIADIGSIRKGTGKSVMRMSVADGYGIGGDSAVVFYKPKNAFRTNSIHQNIDSIGNGSFAAGYLTIASGKNSTAFGYKSVASNFYATTTGYKNISSGTSSFTSGAYNEASAFISTALGGYTKASGQYSTAMGQKTVASGVMSTALGYRTEAKSFLALAGGRYNKNEGSTGSWMDTDPLFILGNGTSDTDRSNAFEVKKNGNTYIPSLYTTTSTNAKKTVLVDDQGKLCVMSTKDDSGEINNLKKENSDLKTRVAKLEALMEQMLNK